jgi:hypothetical protein
VSATTTREHANGWACSDCTMLLANGETPPEWGEDETASWLAEIDRRAEGTEHATLGRLVSEDGCDCETWHSDQHRESCERRDFSWSSCDVCGSTLGGSREAVTFWLVAS